MPLNQKTGRILIVDDNQHIRESLILLLKHDFQHVASLDDPRQVLSMVKHEGFDLILLDMNFSPGEREGNEGFHWLKMILKVDPEACVVLITAFGGVEMAVKGMKLGAADFILKPWNPQKLINNLKSLVQLRHSESQLNRYKSHFQAAMNDPAGGNQVFACKSPSMQHLYETIDKVAPTDASIFLSGENGTGKEVVAADIHRKSARADEIFVSVDLGSLQENLFESELFGHLKGSFTGAHQDRKGRFEIASGGSLFLDEIGNISSPLQAKLLSVFEKREIIQVGGVRPIKVDVRLISATNAPIAEMVARGDFREDLFYRINTIHLHVPPLRERPEDIEDLSRFFLEKSSRKYGKEGLELSLRAISKLKTHPWPGNIRELKHTIEKAVILSDTSLLKPQDLFLRESSRIAESPAMNLQELEKQAICKSLAHHQGNLSKTARQLGITRATLYAKMKKYDL